MRKADHGADEHAAAGQRVAAPLDVDRAAAHRGDVVQAAIWQPARTSSTVSSGLSSEWSIVLAIALLGDRLGSERFGDRHGIASFRDAERRGETLAAAQDAVRLAELFGRGDEQLGSFGVEVEHLVVHRHDESGADVVGESRRFVAAEVAWHPRSGSRPLIGNITTSSGWPAASRSSSSASPS